MLFSRAGHGRSGRNRASIPPGVGPSRFTEGEIQSLLETLAIGTAWVAADVLDVMKMFYNGYRFSTEAFDGLYNPTLSLYFLKYLARHGRYPDLMLDENLAMDRNKLVYVSQLPHGEEILIKAPSGEGALAVPQLARRFGVEDMLKSVKDQTFMASLLITSAF